MRRVLCSCLFRQVSKLTESTRFGRVNQYVVTSVSGDDRYAPLIFVANHGLHQGRDDKAIARFKEAIQRHGYLLRHAGIRDQNSLGVS